MVKRTCSSRRGTSSSAVQVRPGPLDRARAGRKTAKARRSWAKTKRTLAMGSASRGKAAFRRSDPLKTIVPVAALAAAAKKFQGSRATSRK